VANFNRRFHFHVISWAEHLKGPQPCGQFFLCCSSLYPRVWAPGSAWHALIVMHYWCPLQLGNNREASLHFSDTAGETGVQCRGPR